jgi:hypothetical protein
MPPKQSLPKTIEKRGDAKYLEFVDAVIKKYKMTADEVKKATHKGDIPSKLYERIMSKGTDTQKAQFLSFEKQYGYRHAEAANKNGTSAFNAKEYDAYEATLPKQAPLPQAAAPIPEVKPLPEAKPDDQDERLTDEDIKKMGLEIELEPELAAEVAALNIAVKTNSTELAKLQEQHHELERQRLATGVDVTQKRLELDARIANLLAEQATAPQPAGEAQVFVKKEETKHVDPVQQTENVPALNPAGANAAANTAQTPEAVDEEIEQRETQYVEAVIMNPIDANEAKLRDEKTTKAHAKLGFNPNPRYTIPEVQWYKVLDKIEEMKWSRPVSWETTPQPWTIQQLFDVDPFL